MINVVGVLCVPSHRGLEVGRQDRAPRLLELLVGDLGSVVLVFGDEQLLKEELVRQAAHARAALPVGLVAASDEGESLVQGLLDAAVDEPGGGEETLRLGELLVDAGLLFAGQVVGHSAGDDATDDSPPFLLQLLNSPAGGDHLRTGAAVLALDLRPKSGADAFLDLLRKAHGRVMTLDRGLDSCGWQIAQGASGAPLLAPDAKVVEVGALGVDDAQPATALAAVDRALEIVIVGAAFLAVRMLAQDILHGLEEARLHERLMAPLVLLAVEGDVAEVVAVAQQVVDV